MPTLCCCPRKIGRQGQAHEEKPSHILIPVLLLFSSDLLDGAARRVLAGTGSPSLTPFLPSQQPYQCLFPYVVSLCPRPAQCTHQGAGNGFLWFLWAQLFHGIVVLLLFFSHEDVLTSKVKERKKRTSNYNWLSHALGLEPKVQHWEVREIYSLSFPEVSLANSCSRVRQTWDNYTNSKRHLPLFLFSAWVFWDLLGRKDLDYPITDSQERIKFESNDSEDSYISLVPKIFLGLPSW